MPDLTPLFNMHLKAARDQVLQPQLAAIRQQEILADQQAQMQEVDDIAATNAQQNATLNSAALMRGRRAAGGGSYRRRGSATSPNQLVSGLGTASARSLAAQRRSIIADTSRRRQAEATQAAMNNKSLAPRMRIGGAGTFTVLH